MSVPTAQAATFDEVAEFYDRHPNPMLSLEERFLSGLLPELRGLDVVDIGCGTGRWLRRLETSDARSLRGIDPSRRMLEIARRELPSGIALLEGAADALPIADHSANVILMSFALSYCDDIEAAVREIARVARPKTAIFISDLHTTTEAQLQWERAFPSATGAVTMRTMRHDPRILADSFRRVGFELGTYLELPFGTEEREFLMRAGKEAAFEAARNLPAIYIAQFVALTHSTVSIALTGARVAFGANAAVSATISIADDKTATISTSPRSEDATAIDLSGCLILPGLINAHDHLEFGPYFNLGRGPYANSKAWAEDIHLRYRDEIARQLRVPKDVRLYWGALRNLLAGVTSVCHHNPDATVFHDPDFPVRVMENIFWAHSLAFDPATLQKFADGSPERPFVLHAAEGTDEATACEVAELDRLGVLSDRTVVVHGLNCSGQDFDRMNQCGTGLVTCPSSNTFLFGRTLDPTLLIRMNRVALGTDSPLTAKGDLLDEIRVAASAWRLPSSQLYEMCTSNPASILRAQYGEGAIGAGAAADFVVVRDNGQSPAERLSDLSFEDIELVIVRGRVHLASKEGLRRIPSALRAGLEPLMVDNVPRWVRAPLEWMFEETEGALGPGLVLGKKRVAYAG